MADFADQVDLSAKRRLGSKDSLLRVIATAWWPNWKHDADFEILWDCLQECGVISNDRWIREKLLFAEIDAKNPRCEILIEPI